MAGRIYDGDYGFPLGMSSGTYPERLIAGQYARSWNTVNRGGLIRCRPGYETKFTLPAGRLQGLWEYRPLSSEPALIAAVDGRIYISPQPFDTYFPLPNLQFRADAEYLYAELCIQVVERNDDGSSTLIDPRAVLVFQDGLSVPGYFDGAVSRHIPDTDFKLPQGTIMKWSGNRLWVARRDALFASDIGNPFAFQEGQYVGTINAFVLPGRITAIAEVPSITRASLAVFTGDTTTLIQSNLQERALWPVTPDFFKTVFKNIGCTSHLSPVPHHGVLWWMSKLGMQRLDVAISAERSTAQPILDNEMAVSKGFLAPNLRSCAGVSFENYMLQSVPHASFENTHTWVHDSNPENDAWNSYWTGTRPHSWVAGLYNGVPRCFFASRDYDGVNRVWEAFQSERLDNGCRIKWGVETRGYNGGNMLPKKFQYAELSFSELRGTVDVKVAWANSKRGPFKRILDKRIEATRGSIAMDRDMTTGKNEFALKPQSRLLYTQDVNHVQTQPFSSCGVESDKEDWLGSSFQLCVIVEGEGALEYTRIFMNDENDQMDGKCEPDETDSRASRYDGASAAGDTDEEAISALEADDPVEFSSMRTVTLTQDGISAVATATGFSSISQEAADYAAECTARLKAQAILSAQLPAHLGGFAEGFPSL